MYDIIGDIHGHADELRHLLEQLGYERDDGTYTHATRKAVFVGDFIDRGPKISEVLQTVRAMVENGHALAVMGNHEFNAIAYHTAHPDNDGRFLREHTEKNEEQHEQTLKQLTAGELAESIEWFRSLPMWLELDGIRVVHACWDTQSISVIQRALTEHGGVTTPFMQAATHKTDPLFQAIEDVLKGKELALPTGVSFKDKEGRERTQVRIRWFELPAGMTYQQYALPASAEIPNEPVPESAAENITPYAPVAKPVFIGHYWLPPKRPQRLAPNVACVDYSVAKKGMLCAYRWDGERELDDEKFVSVESAKL